ncbi:MAG: hypothetical protein KKC79_02875 [Gammaproteobacteria bacterium]|nr:hypothetical protein [Gammaproteobacteria bacterium]MBU1440299.1 hypothetical protein [Gammaproteobacteria bacterium]MBU2407573.1 hypothetical protein [Gammaproteobacteria bacterium]
MSAVDKLPQHVDRSSMQAVLRARLQAVNSRESDSGQAFLLRVSKWMHRWSQQCLAEKGAAGIKGIAPFAVVMPPLAGVDPSAGWADTPFFDEEPPTDLGGCIAVTSTSFAHVQTLSTGCTRLNDLGERLTDLGLRDQPMAVVIPSKGLVQLCPGGVFSERISINLDAAPLTDVDETTMDRELASFHDSHTRYPNGFSHAWHDRKQRVLRRDAEDIVRDSLFIYLHYKAFRSKIVVREHQTSVGRSDISLLDNSSNQPITACVMELKVLRSRGMTKSKNEKPYKPEAMRRHCLMGVKQAIKYKSVENAPLAYLCLYDGRDADDEVLDAKTAADAGVILYRRYFMETSTRDDLAVALA